MPAIAGCTNTACRNEGDEFGTYNYDQLPGNEAIVTSFYATRTGDVNYYANLKRPEEGYAGDSPVDAYIFRAEGSRIYSPSLISEIPSNYEIIHENQDIDENEDATATVPPGWFHFVIDNTSGKADLEVEMGGRVDYCTSSSKTLSEDCNNTITSDIHIERLSYTDYGGGDSAYIFYNFWLNNPSSEAYSWEIRLETTAETVTTSKTVQSEPCSAHMVGLWEFSEDNINTDEDQGKVTITAEGDNKSIQKESWIDIRFG